MGNMTLEKEDKNLEAAITLWTKISEDVEIKSTYKIQDIDRNATRLEYVYDFDYFNYNYTTSGS